MCILFKNNFEFNIHNIYKDHDGNLLLLDIEIEKNRISFGVVYGPNKDNPSFYTNLKNSVSKMGNQHIILVGDWNMLLDPELDGKNYKNINNPNARQKVLQLITELDLYDIFRCENNEKQLYTWKRKISSGLIQMGRLDFFLISESLLSYSKKVSIHPAYRSDHNLISLSLVFNKPQKNKNFWKFNNSLLYDTDFITEVKSLLTELKIQYGATPYNPLNINEIENQSLHLKINPQLFFETILLEIRSKAISFSTDRKKKENLLLLT